VVGGGGGGGGGGGVVGALEGQNILLKKGPRGKKEKGYINGFYICSLMNLYKNTTRKKKRMSFQSFLNQKKKVSQKFSD